MDNLFEHSKLQWQPLNPACTRVEALRRMINHKHGLQLKNYHDLHKYSVEDYSFWKDLWDFLGIIYSVPPSKIIEEGRKPYLPTWFPGTHLNYAENLLSRNDDGIAVTAARETGPSEHYSWKDLRKRVAEIADALRGAGVGVGDRIAAVVTNHIIAITIALASSSVGAVFSPTATDMGTQGILERYRQIRPVIIFAETEVVYNGKPVDLTPKIRSVTHDLLDHGLRRVILLPSVLRGTAREDHSVPISLSLSEFIATGAGRPLTFEQLPFNQPLYILYSSGTSGPPKCIVHSQGGVLLQNKKDGAISFGFQPDDTYFQFTTTGWMMWPFMLIGLACGTRIIAYDGSPFYPDVRKFLKFISDERVSVFGTSPRFLTEVQSREIRPLELAPFESLRTIFSTGAVLTPPMFEWTQKAFGQRVHIASSSGGTDICGAFVTSIESMPVHSGEIQGKALGMAVEIFDPDGKNIEHTGQAGELVCTRPHPSLPVAFWGDDDGEKLRKAYFDAFPGVWRQGDFIVLNPKTKGLVILGRSDGVLNPSGVRFGSAEIYTVLERFSHTVDDSLCIGQRRPKLDKDERVLLFLKMRKGFKLTSQLEIEIREAIKTSLSARHVPKYIFEIEDVPYTVNNKKIEIAVKHIVSGTAVKPSGTVANPDSLKLYHKYYHLESVLAGGKRECKVKL